MREIYHNYIQS